MKKRIRVFITLFVLFVLLISGCSSSKPNTAAVSVTDAKSSESQPLTPKQEEKTALPPTQLPEPTEKPIVSVQTQPQPISTSTPVVNPTTTTTPPASVSDPTPIVATAIIAGAVATSQPTTSQPEPQVVHNQTATEKLVWIPTNGGTKYHSISTCSNMINPLEVPLSEAISKGFEAYKRCYK